MEYTIRPCTPADLDKLVQLCAQHAAYEQASYDPQGKKEKLHALLFTGHRPLHCLMVETAGLVIGYATYTFDVSTWDAAPFVYLDCLYIEEAFRNYGIGRVLMEQVKAAGEQQYCVNMQWQTPDFNEHAIRFYKRLGATDKNKVRFTLPLNTTA
jgi:ribosomal protein S18 acetylase RimI-like enzyme